MKLIVCAYMPAEEAINMANLTFIGQLQLVQADQRNALKGFEQYLTGYRGPGRPMSQPKVAVVKTSSYTLLLKEAADLKARGHALDCWVCMR